VLFAVGDGLRLAACGLRLDLRYGALRQLVEFSIRFEHSAPVALFAQLPDGTRPAGLGNHLFAPVEQPIGFF
jgi:hypothetical protein